MEHFVLLESVVIDTNGRLALVEYLFCIVTEAKIKISLNSNGVCSWHFLKI